ncbi:MAG: hypothetical protein ACI92Z_002826, partial [Paracoccaceae bacterium]
AAIAQGVIGKVLAHLFNQYLLHQQHVVFPQNREKCAFAAPVMQQGFRGKSRHSTKETYSPPLGVRRKVDVLAY